ncbi:MAG TPA: hypothetical protein VKR38_04490 [Usitatibacter sp.]|nr:hypothetical protein [Usitatibacter sp.]
MNRKVATVAVALAAASIFPAFAETSALDGRTFEGVFLQRGKTSGDADTLSFRNGRFHSSACDRYGYADASYRTSSAGDMTRFEAVTESAKYGRLVWNGTVQAGKLDAKVMMVRDGHTDIENWVVAGETK